MTNKTRQIIVVVAVFVIALASLGTVIGLMVNTGQMSEYSNGFRFELKGSRATIIGYEGSDDDVIVPDKIKGNRVVGVASGAFNDSDIKSIKFNCTYSSFSIAGEAFKDLSTLEKVVLPSNLKEISYGAFKNCKALKSVIMPNSVTLIGEDAFRDCSSLNFIYNKENYTTDGAGSIKSDAMYLPSSLLEIGAHAFDGCTAIIEVHFAKDLEKIGDYAFNACTKFSDIELASDIEVTSIGDWAFYNTMLNSTSSNQLNFPNLVSVGASAFKSVTSNFSYFALPKSIKNIGANAFEDCTSISKFVIAEEAQIETMGEGVFEGCSMLSDITIPTEIKEIPARTFMGCYRLLYNNDFVIGKSVETIGEGAFAIYADKTSTSDYTRYELKVDEENENFVITKLENIKEGKTSSYNKQGLLTDANGSTVYAYYGNYDSNCHNSMGATFRFLDEDGNFLTSITTIKSYAFAGVNFEYIQIPSTIKQVEDYIFYGSKVNACYTSAVPWELTSKSFSKATDGDPEVEVLILSNIAGVDEFINKLGEYNVDASTYSGNLQ